MNQEKQRQVSQLCASKRRIWQPNNPPPLSETSKAPDTISRCLSLTALEPAVARFINTGLSRSDSSKLDPELVATLLQNVKDEERHEVALTRAAAALVGRVDHLIAAEQLIQAWEDLSDNPITKAAVLECGVFFVILPLYSQFGGASLRITSASISGDERLHVISHRAASQAIGARPSRALDKLRRDTVAWISETLGYEVGGNWSKDRMVANSDTLMKRGVSDLGESRVANVNAPYEISNNSIESYTSSQPS